MTVPESSSRLQMTSTHDAFSLLERGVPLSLLLDLALRVDSRDIYASEAGTADWLVVRRSA